MTDDRASAERGVQFVSRDGSRSSTAAAREVISAAVAAVDADLAQRIRSTSNWRKAYVPVFRDAVAAGVRTNKAALQIAESGLSALHDNVVFESDGGPLPVRRALDDVDQPPLQTVDIDGENDLVRELVVPYRGEALRGDALRHRIDAWQRDGILEWSAAEALHEVVRHPEWVDLRDQTFVLLGASSQMGSLEMVSAWGAHVAAVDLPRDNLWENIFKLVRRGSGTCSVPVREGTEASPAVAGMDLLTETPRAWRWIAQLDRAPVVCNYVYADGARFVRLAAAADALVGAAFERWDDAALAYLATPTDVFAVPDEVVRETRAAKGRLRAVRAALRPATLGKTFAPNYERVVTGEDGTTWGLADALVPIQGPNYALAKSLQRWRAVASKEAGRVVSANVAPATRTQSVVKNRMLAAAYRGAGAFGIEIFEAETSRALMAALLVHDIRTEPRHLGHPYELFTSGAVHGGLWRSSYEPRSVLPLALLLGSMKRH